MIAGGLLGCYMYCLRQHLKPDSSHTAEITAGGTMIHRVIPVRGLCQEMHVPQLRPVPAYTDSQSTIFCANSAASARLSVWVNRRSAVLRECVDESLVAMHKISDADNCANYYTKPVTTAVMNHYFDYMLPKGRQHSFQEWRASHVAPRSHSSAVTTPLNNAINNQRVINVIARDFDFPPLLVPPTACRIAVGELAKLGDNTVGDILCCCDKYGQVVLRDWQG